MMFFDTHAHLNFKRLTKILPEVIDQAHQSGVKYMVVPGTDEDSSQKAVDIADQNANIYAAVGIHPHHAFETADQEEGRTLDSRIQILEKLLQIPNNKIVAIGEIGLDRHSYEETKYQNYHVDGSFMNRQKALFVAQLQLAKTYKLSVILHNREAKDDFLGLLNDNWDQFFSGRIVFHCCEPDETLLKYATDHNIFIGVDGDITYNEEKQRFVKQIPTELLLLETDSPFLLPEPLRTEKKYPNTPANIPLIAEFIAGLRGESLNDLAKTTTDNAMKLFCIDPVPSS